MVTPEEVKVVVQRCVILVTLFLGEWRPLAAGYNRFVAWP